VELVEELQYFLQLLTKIHQINDNFVKIILFKNFQSQAFKIEYILVLIQLYLRFFASFSKIQLYFNLKYTLISLILSIFIKTKNTKLVVVDPVVIITTNYIIYKI